MDMNQTAEIHARRVTLVKIGENGSACKEKVAGVEWGVPTSGSAYMLYLGNGKFLKTSPIKELKEIHNAVMFRTVNSVYRIEYPE